MEGVYLILSVVLFLTLTSLLTLFIKEKGFKISFALGSLALVLLTLFLFQQEHIVYKELFELKISDIFILRFTSLFALFMLLFGYAQKKINPPLFFLILFLPFGSVMTLGAKNILLFYLGIETLSLLGFALLSYGHEKNAIAAAGRYFFQSIIISSLFLFGLALYFGAIGGLSLELTHVYKKNLFLFANLFFFITFLFKLGAFPLHHWVRSIYVQFDGMRAGSYFALIKIPMAFALYRFLKRNLSLLSPEVQKVFCILIAVITLATLIYGYLMAIGQKNTKEVMGFSAVANAGFIIYALMLPSLENQIPHYSLIIFLIVYGIASSGMFLLLDRKRSRLALHQDSPIMALAGVIFVLSLAGLPYNLGFISKMQLFIGYYQGLAPQWVTSLILFLTVFSIFYYIKIISSFYFKEKQDNHEGVSSFHPFAKTLLVAMATVLALGTFLF